METDTKTVYADIEIYHRNYWRPDSDFNPTLTSNKQLIPYNFEKWNTKDEGFILLSKQEKREVHIYDANFTMKNLNFT